ncbi:MAG: hypothetical protein M3378_07845 [Actinomycetota bacterium]|nr:hypothetical protein [Actinomycetota bacterium]
MSQHTHARAIRSAGRLLAVTLVALTTTVLVGGGAQAEQRIMEFPVPTPASEPAGIARGSDNNLWFTESAGNKIGRITPAGVITEFPLGDDAFPVGITAGPDGALWFTDESDRIGRITTDGAVTWFPTPTKGGVPHGIVTGPDGALWFSYLFRDLIGRVTTAGEFTEHPIPTFRAEVHSITVGSDGALWFTEFRGNKIGRITTAGVITEFPIPTPDSRPHGIVAGPDGALWFTEQGGNKIGRITTSGVFSEYPLPNPGSGPHEIAVGEDGNLWFTEILGNRIGRITTAGVITEFPIPTPDSGAGYIVAGPDGAMWFHERRANQIGRISIERPRYSEWSAATNAEAVPGTSASLNTPFADGCPLVSKHDRQLYIASNRPGGQGGLDIWVAEGARRGRGWGEPQNLGPSINTAANEFCPTPTRDGHGLFFVSNRPGGCGGGDIYFTRRHPKRGWSEPQNLGCSINSAAEEASPFPVGDELYFSSTRPGGFAADAPGAASGDSDIYVSTRQGDGTYGVPSLVPGVNTAYDDARPNVGRDGLEIFFDSNRPGGLGGFDIWTATRTSLSGPWAVPVNLGPAVNSSANETRPSLSWDATTLYFGSTRAGSEAGPTGAPSQDIYFSTRQKLTGPPRNS